VTAKRVAALALKLCCLLLATNISFVTDARAAERDILDGTWRLVDARETSAAVQDNRPTCTPPGVPLIMTTGKPFEIISSRGQVNFVFEQDHNQRWIHLDVPHTADVDPTYMGEAVGRWDGATLVIDTIGFNTLTALDSVGHRHTDQLHVVERLSLIDADRLQDVMTIQDPGTFEGVQTQKHIYARIPRRRLVEEVCEERGVDIQSLKVDVQ
jgi:hypothetical protein